MLSVDRERKKDGRRLDRVYVIICIIATQLQLQFIIHFLPVSSGFHFYTHAFRSLLRVFCALPTVNCRLLRHIRDVTLTRAEITDITLSRMTLAPAAIFCPGIGTRSQQKRSKRSKRSDVMGPYIPYGLFQTKGEMCTKFGSDWFRNVNLYKVQTNKQTNFQLYIFV